MTIMIYYKMKLKHIVLGGIFSTDNRVVSSCRPVISNDTACLLPDKHAAP